MANVHPVATMCEVTYDSEWYEDDRFMTPYRYSLMRNDTESNSDTVSLTLPCYTYYEYLRSLYDCRLTTLHRNLPGFPPSGGSERLPDRAKTWHEFGSERTSVQASRQAAHSEPVKIRPTYPFPSLHLIQQGATSGDESDDENYVDRSKEKLVWVDALNRWIPEHQTPGGVDYSEPLLCERFEQHMGRGSISQPSPPRTQRASDRREEVRKRAQEIAEERKQRKAYSTPSYTSMTERKHKTRTRSAKGPASTPVSPIQKVVKAPPPKEVWQPKDTPRAASKEKMPPLRKELSITLHTPKPEEKEIVTIPALGEKDKHVTFEEEDAGRAVEEKDKEDEESRHNKTVAESIAAEKRLIEALEKQRQQQLAEEQRLLEEQQREKERLARERELQAEKERLEKERERLLQLQKDPKKHGLMNSHKQQQENYYESTMNAAGYYHNVGKETNTIQDSSKEKSTIRNKNLNRGVLKPKEPAPSRTDKIEKKNLVNVAKTKNTDTVNTQKSVPGGTSYVPSKETKVKKSESNSKDVVIKIEEPVINEMRKENSFTEPGGKRRKGKGEGSKSQKKKGAKEKAKKKSEDEEEEKHQPETNLIQDPTPGTSVQKKPDSVVTIKNTKTVEKKTKQGNKRVKDEETGSQAKPVKPMLAGMSTTPKPPSATSPGKIPLPAEEKLQVSSAEELIEQPRKIQQKQQSEENSTAQKSGENELPYEKRKSVSQRVKEIKEKKERPCAKKESSEKLETLPPLPSEAKKAESWIFDAEDFSEKVQISQYEEEPAEVLVPTFSADLQPDIVAEEKKRAKDKRRKSFIDSKIKSESKAKKWHKPGKLDTSYNDDWQRLELAEERRKRQMEMLERLKGQQMDLLDGQEDDGSPHFEDYGFLAKYCIFTKGNIEMYRHAFDAVDDEHKGWLEGQEVMIALRGVNSKLTEAEEEYMYRILELTGYKLTNGADFKMFSVLAALSQRISALDMWMRNLIGKMDFKMLEMKMFMCKTLWECNVDPDTNKISLDQLCVDLRAGGVSFEHELEVREKLSHMDALDLLDFLTYVPLFIMIHESVVKNPLDDTRMK